MALQEHLDGAAVEELYLTVLEVLRRDAFFTELRERDFALGNLHIILTKISQKTFFIQRGNVSRIYQFSDCFPFLAITFGLD